MEAMRRALTPALAAGLLVALAVPALAEEKPYRISLIGDGFDGTAWHTGVLIELAPGWKTYWRVPGEAGVPPQIELSGAAGARLELECPVPQRIADQSGEAIGKSRGEFARSKL